MSSDTAPLLVNDEEIKITKTNKLSNVLSIHKEGFENVKLNQQLDEYYSLFDDNNDMSDDKPNLRQQKYKTFITNFYNLVTDFYEYGWGESFHFACRHAKESFDQSIARSEHYVGLRLGLKPGMKVLDVGCGVGGPQREIARFTGAHITGINISQYQIERAKSHIVRDNLTKYCSLIKGDFLHIPTKDASFDAAYSIEATCHSPSKVDLFKEIYRVIKPGGLFCSYEWVMTDKYDPKNPRHQEIKKGIEKGNALPDIPHYSASIDALKKAGFELIEATDFGKPTDENPVPWYDPLDGKISISNFRFTRVGRWLTEVMVNVLENLWIAPSGSLGAARMLNETAIHLVDGGKLGIFTPSFFILGRKPAQ